MKGNGSVSPERIDAARERIRSADGVVILTGAGVSAESGVPTFRGAEGLWRDFRPEELATPQAFRRDPELVWEWYRWRRELIGECEPNPAHRAIAELQHARDDAVLVTQNVDGLHALALERSGGGDPVPPPRRGHRGPSPEILEVHGSIFRVRCSSCSWTGGRDHPTETDIEAALPRCPECGELVRPDVVWFGEALDPRVLERSVEVARRADVCLVVGTSALVHPAASIPRVTLDAGGCLIEVNPDATPLSPVAEICLRGPAGSVVPEILS